MHYRYKNHGIRCGLVGQKFYCKARLTSTIHVDIVGRNGGQEIATMAKLSALKVRTLASPGRYGDGGNLWFQVRDADHRSWLFRYTLHGRARQMGLGPYPDVPLAEARECARTCRAQVRAGVDPIDHRAADMQAKRQAATGGITFAGVAERYLAAHEATWRNEKHRYQWRATLTTAATAFGDKSVSAIGTGDVTGLLEPMWRKTPETASRLRGRIESVLDYARVHGWRAGDNPARWKGHLDHILPSASQVARVEHHPALPWRDIGAFMAALRPQPGVAALALRFTVLTASRTGEVIGARWVEMDLDSAIWSIPGDRMKAGRPHRVPLSAPCVALLRAVEPYRTQGEWIFPGGKAGKPLSNMSMTMTLRRMDRHDITVHGFRSTFRDWCSEATDYPGDVAEAALAHVIGDKVEAAYRRGDLFDKRRSLMNDWAAFCNNS
jgi:integrase